MFFYSRNVLNEILIKIILMKLKEMIGNVSSVKQNQYGISEPYAMQLSSMWSIKIKSTVVYFIFK